MKTLMKMLNSYPIESGLGWFISELEIHNPDGDDSISEVTIM